MEYQIKKLWVQKQIIRIYREEIEPQRHKDTEVASQFLIFIGSQKPWTGAVNN
jgi:hypothetical protein